MANVYQFPTQADKILVHGIINSFAKGKCTRVTMMCQIGHIFDTLHINKLNIFNYTVKLIDRFGDIPVIYIEAKEIHDKCPTCHSTTASYLLTQEENLKKDYDVISVTCLDCGCVYATKAPNGRRNSVEKDHFRS